ncbi:hypothetical protein C0989_001378 [Termitomyces sp. Mn162]|nr:hypothetical protein C0989_001378 [Termitomyces sp. Mn162]
MSSNFSTPTVPHRTPTGPAARLPCAPLTACPSSGLNLPDNFVLLQCSIKCDTHQVILVVLQLPLFAQTIIGFCRVVAGIPETQADCAQYLGTMQLDPDVDMLGPSSICSGKCQANTDPVGKPKPKTIKVLPAFANLKPGSKAVLSLLGQVDAALKAIQLADDGALLPRADLQQHCDAVHLATQQQLHLLNITLQTYKLILTCLIHLDKTLSPSDIEHTGGLLNGLQVSPEV